MDTVFRMRANGVEVVTDAGSGRTEHRFRHGLSTLLVSAGMRAPRRNPRLNLATGEVLMTG